MSLQSNAATPGKAPSKRQKWRDVMRNIRDNARRNVYDKFRSSTDKLRYQDPATLLKVLIGLLSVVSALSALCGSVFIHEHINGDVDDDTKENVLLLVLSSLMLIAVVLIGIFLIMKWKTIGKMYLVLGVLLGIVLPLVFIIPGFYCALNFPNGKTWNDWLLGAGILFILLAVVLLGLSIYFYVKVYKPAQLSKVVVQGTDREAKFLETVRGGTDASGSGRDAGSAATASTRYIESKDKAAETKIVPKVPSSPPPAKEEEAKGPGRESRDKADETENVPEVPTSPPLAKEEKKEGPSSSPSTKEEEEKGPGTEVSAVAATKEGTVEENKEEQEGEEENLWGEEIGKIVSTITDGIDQDLQNGQTLSNEVYGKFMDDDITQEEVQKVINEDLTEKNKGQMNPGVFNNLQKFANLLLEGFQKGYI